MVGRGRLSVFAAGRENCAIRYRGREVSRVTPLIYFQDVARSREKSQFHFGVRKVFIPDIELPPDPRGELFFCFSPDVAEGHERWAHIFVPLPPPHPTFLTFIFLSPDIKISGIKTQHVCCMWLFIFKVISREIALCFINGWRVSSERSAVI